MTGSHIAMTSRRMRTMLALLLVATLALLLVANLVGGGPRTGVPFHWLHEPGLMGSPHLAPAQSP